MNRKILVVAAHPDDEVLGCGGTIARHAHEGDEVHVLIVGEGVTSRDSAGGPGLQEQQLSAIRQAAIKAASVLGARPPRFLGLPDNRLDSVPLLDVIKEIETVVAEIRPELIYTHHGSDLNVDHRIVHQAVTTTCRPMPQQGVGNLLFFEIPSSTNWQAPGSFPPFNPNWHVDISGTLGKKMEALRAYGAEMRPWPHARSLEACEHQARWRGASVGLDAAEAFELGRMLVR